MDFLRQLQGHKVYTRSRGGAKEQGNIGMEVKGKFGSLGPNGANRWSDSWGVGTQDTRGGTGSSFRCTGNPGYFGCLAMEASESEESELVDSGTEDEVDIAATGAFDEDSDVDGLHFFNSSSESAAGVEGNKSWGS